VAGCTESFGAGANDVWFLRTDGSGDTLWTCTYGDTGLDESYAVLQTADLGYIIAGATTSAGAGSYDAWLIKTGPEDPTAVNEPPPAPASRPVAGTTVVRNVLNLPASFLRSRPSSLLDISGRSVLPLAPGPNDVRSLPPGVYFIQAISREPSAMNCRKVVVSR